MKITHTSFLPRKTKVPKLTPFYDVIKTDELCKALHNSSYEKFYIM